MTITCSDCDFWNLPAWHSEDNQAAACECRRKAPTMEPVDNGTYENALWPRTRPADWCGDAEPLTEATKADREARREAQKDSPFAKLMRPALSAT